MQTYYRVVCDQADEMAGDGLGYEEIYGSKGRYFWTREQADRRTAELNAQTANDNATGTYSVEERRWYDDGRFDDEDDDFAREQLKPDLV